MGLGLTFVFLFPLTIGLLLLWAISGKSFFGQVLAAMWGLLIVLIVVSGISSLLTADGTLEKEDYYGQYVICRDYFPGKQADWQYDNFRFEIKDDDSIYFYVTQQEKVVRVFTGTIATVKPSTSERLVLHLAQPTHHILSDNPTTYRNARGFYLVFNSPKFGNVFFKKGEWKPLAK